MSVTAVKERPILFSGEMVRAILAGTKTQTRRILKPQPPEGWHPLGVERYSPETVDRDGMLTDGPEIFGAYGWDWGVKCPYGVPGDRLWVRETFQAFKPGKTQLGGSGAFAGMQMREYAYPLIAGESEIEYAADYEKPKLRTWRASTRLPRWASRITLELTDVRVERVQDISEADAIHEGVKTDNFGHFFDYSLPAGGYRETVSALTSAKESFRTLWNRVNGDGAWERNDWCWALSFRRLP